MRLSACEAGLPMSCEPLLLPGALEVVGLGKCYRTYHKPSDWLKERLFRRPYAKERWVLRGVNFVLAPGEALGVIGQNGAGKSTLLQLVTGTLTPSEGYVRRQGRITALLELGAGFNPEFTGRENARLNAALMGMKPEEIEDLMPKILAFAELGEAIDRPVKTYSSGMYVRLAFSIATAVEPDILIIDEALAVGDGAFARKSFDRIMALRERGTTLLFCSHALYQVRQLCSRALWLHQGQVQMPGTAEEVTIAYQEFLDRQVTGGVEPQHLNARAVSSEVSGHARLVDIRIEVDGYPYTEAVALSGESTLTVTVSFHSDPLLPAPRIGVILHTADGRNLSSMGNWIDAPLDPIPRAPDGTGRVRLVVPNLPLLAGNYPISVFLLCEQGIHVYDQALRLGPVCVQAKDERIGYVRIAYHWEMA